MRVRSRACSLSPFNIDTCDWRARSRAFVLHWTTTDTLLPPVLDYSRALSSQYGQQALSFYTTTKNSLKDVHEEASRIAADKKHASAIAGDINTADAADNTTAASVASTSQPVGAATTGGMPAIRSV